MATTYGNQFVNGFEVTTGIDTVYQVPSSGFSKVVIANATARNYGASTANLTLWMIPDGESTADNFKAIIDRTLSPGETVIMAEIIGEPINAGGQIEAQASLNTHISLTIGGSVET